MEFLWAILFASSLSRTGTLDDLTDVSDNIPNAALKIVSQCGHMSPVEQPETITDLMQSWLQLLRKTE
jgi:pimeloyl-ACP methyl ester carboxylesterase